MSESKGFDGALLVKDGEAMDKNDFLLICTSLFSYLLPISIYSLETDQRVI